MTAQYAAGCRMPSGHSITKADEFHRTDAEIRNERFVEALLQCIRNGGAG
jgi:hypothetical protein